MPRCGRNCGAGCGSLHDEIHITSVFVTHDQEEALELANRVVVMNEGRIEQVGSPDEVYNHPATPFVYNFLGNVNLFHGRVDDGKAYHRSKRRPEHVVYVRPHLLEIDRQPNGAATIFGPGSSTSTRPVLW